MTQQCLEYFFGMCVQSEAQAREMILAAGVGAGLGISAIAVIMVSTFLGAKMTLKLVEWSGLVLGLGVAVVFVLMEQNIILEQ